MKTPTFPIDYNVIRKAFIAEMMRMTLLDQNHVITAEGESPNQPRPTLPYMMMKITTPAAKFGDDFKQKIQDEPGKPTTLWNSGGPRKMTVEFNAYGRSHEEAYNYMSLWNAALDTEPTQENLRAAGVAVWVIGTVADLSALLNTGYEGRAHMECTFGVAFNITSDLGAIESVQVDGAITTDQNEVVQTESEITIED